MPTLCRADHQILPYLNTNVSSNIAWSRGFRTLVPVTIWYAGRGGANLVAYGVAYHEPNVDGIVKESKLGADRSICLRPTAT